MCKSKITEAKLINCLEIPHHGIKKSSKRCVFFCVCPHRSKRGGFRDDGSGEPGHVGPALPAQEVPEDGDGIAAAADGRGGDGGADGCRRLGRSSQRVRPVRVSVLPDGVRQAERAAEARARAHQRAALSLQVLAPCSPHQHPPLPGPHGHLVCWCLFFGTKRCPCASNGASSLIHFY